MGRQLKAQALAVLLLAGCGQSAESNLARCDFEGTKAAGSTPVDFGFRRIQIRHSCMVAAGFKYDYDAQAKDVSATVSRPEEAYWKRDWLRW